MIQLQSPEARFHVKFKYRQKKGAPLVETEPIEITIEEYEQLTGGNTNVSNQ